MNKDTTILIQGPLDETALSNYNNYKKYGNVIISVWENEYIKNIFEKFNIEINEQVIIRKLPSLPSHPGINSSCKFYFAIKSISHALDSIKTEYTIRTRSDEMYENLDVLINKFNQDTNKFVFGNIFARRYSEYVNHIGDHFYMIKTDYLKKTISLLIDMYEKNLNYESWANNQRIPPECILANAFMKIKNIPQSEWSNKNIIRDNFDIIDINETKKFIAKWQGQGKTYTNKFENHHGTFKCMDDYLI